MGGSVGKIAMVVAIAVAAAYTGGAAAGFLGYAAGTTGYLVTSAVVGAVVSMAGGALMSGIMGRPKVPELSPPVNSSTGYDQHRGVLLNESSPIAPIPVIYGTRRVGGTRVFIGASGTNNSDLHLLIALSEGPVSAINTVYIDGTASTAAKYSGLVTVYKHLGATDQAADSAMISAFPDEWTQDHRLRGVAYVHVVLTWNQDAFAGLPTITADVDGKTVEDFRTSTIAYSNNPVVCLYDYITNTTYGRGLDAADIDADSWTTAANYCDQSVVDPDATRERYTCNGVLRTDQPVLENIKQILSSCRGMLIWSAGKYKLILDSATASTFDFDADNIVGAWTITKAGKRDKFNRIRATWINPENNWQPDIMPVENLTYRAQDNNSIIENQIELLFTTNGYMAQRIAGLNLQQSRMGIHVSFRATLEALAVEVGDVVTITHDTPGWAAKKFRVVRMRIVETGDVEVEAREYDDAVYTVTPSGTITTAPSSLLPDPSVVSSPGAPTITESLYVTRNGAGVKAQAYVSWSEAADAYVNAYRLEWQPAGAGTWGNGSTTTVASHTIQDVAPGNYDFRVKAVNSMGYASSWVQTLGVEIVGLSAPPAAISGLTMFASGGLAILRWTQSTDLDVTQGGNIVIRHSSLQTGAEWSGSVSIGDAVPGSATVAVLPLVAGTYLVKAQDSSGIQSATASTVSTEGAIWLPYTTLSTVNEGASGWLGSHSGTIDDAGTLKLVGAASMDSWADVDSVASWDSVGGVASSGTYTFATGIDLGSVQRVRLVGAITAQVSNVNDLIDSRLDLIDSWADFDGTSAASADAQIWTRKTDDNPSGSPSWSAWQRIEAAEFRGRAFQFQARLSSTDSSYNIGVSATTIDAFQAS